MGWCAPIRPPGRDELLGGRSREAPSERESFLWEEQNLGEFGESSRIGDRWSDRHRDPGRARLRPALSGQCQCRGLSCLASAPRPPLAGAWGEPISPGPLWCLLKPDRSGRDEAGANARGRGLERDRAAL